MDVVRVDIDSWGKRHGTMSHKIHDVVSLFGSGGQHWVAGGAVRSFLLGASLSTDVDVFFRDEQSHDEFLKQHCTGRRHSSNHVTTWTMSIGGDEVKVQAIRIGWYADATALIDSFDYTICQAAIDDGSVVTTPTALWDIASRRLAIHKVTYPIATVNRLVKYRMQGFGSCKGTISDILAAVVSLPSLMSSDIAYVD